jgi:hypothetical protein
LITRATRARALQLTANAAQLSLRDLRLRPLRAVVQVPESEPEASPLENAVLAYAQSLLSQ